MTKFDKENLKLIAAIGQNRELGCKNDLIWRIKEDMQFFRQQTLDNYIIMGRKTYESLPPKLPRRRYIVLTSDRNLVPNEDLLIHRNIEDTLGFVDANQGEGFYVIGGGQIYKEFLPYVSLMHLTEIQATCEDADTFFPSFDKNEWDIERGCLFNVCGEIPYTHVLYKRK